jgi:hypothetical protein
MKNHGGPPMLATGSDEASPPVWAYLICLALQSAAALAIIAAIQTAFRTVIDDLGVRHPVSLAEFTMLVGTMCCSQAVYWYRVARIDIPRWRGLVLGHLVGFASRLSFIFGGALFSVFFLRHAPELGSSEGAIILLPRVAVLLASLFCLYCFTLELERLGNALQSDGDETLRRPHPAGRLPLPDEQHR